jgi:hypothetical protein
MAERPRQKKGSARSHDFTVVAAIWLPSWLQIEQQLQRLAHAGDLAGLLAEAIGKETVDVAARCLFLTVFFTQRFQQGAQFGNGFALFIIITYEVDDLEAFINKLQVFLLCNRLGSLPVGAPCSWEFEFNLVAPAPDKAPGIQSAPATFFNS